MFEFKKIETKWVLISYTEKIIYAPLLDVLGEYVNRHLAVQGWNSQVVCSHLVFLFQTSLFCLSDQMMNTEKWQTLNSSI